MVNAKLQGIQGRRGAPPATYTNVGNKMIGGASAMLAAENNAVPAPSPAEDKIEMEQMEARLLESQQATSARMVASQQAFFAQMAAQLQSTLSAQAVQSRSNDESQTTAR